MPTAPTSKPQAPSLLQRYGGAITNAVGTVLALPKTIPAALNARQANADADAMQRARQYKGQPNFVDGVPTEGFKARTMAGVAKENTIARGAKLAGRYAGKK